MQESEYEVECSGKNEFLYESKNLLQEFTDVAYEDEFVGLLARCLCYESYGALV